ncbi:hypothetical protein HYP06_gp095 [Vibrio phage vB_VspP_pVa5]|uniref:Uncharacterized protein n=1 Tax=Vibrio phage vB_VspP_pVa5 TaxID=1913109 RepID=A0A1J0GV86_9CAUD|nr:hypothetical protein HYP06_gp095 [Vibrio phage vB_VspP_pVa5]APC46085.1 hypothetical protein vBVspPpVa5_0078 [Vibrio phage vB_VspP_pVa5]
MRVQLYRLPPFKEFGMGWMLVDENDDFKIWNDEGIPDLPYFEITEQGSTDLYEFITSGENPQLELVETTLDEAYNHIQMTMLLEQ